MSSEAKVQAEVREKASQLGWRLWRNNVGVFVDERGVPVRYGLANESSAMNKVVKSSDLIGLRPVVITPDMVGQTIGQFVAIECKHGEWSMRENDKHAGAQKAFIEMVKKLGGHGLFATDKEQLC